MSTPNPSRAVPGAPPSRGGAHATGWPALGLGAPTRTRQLDDVAVAAPAADLAAEPPFDALPMAIALFDRSLRLVHANAAFRALTRYDVMAGALAPSLHELFPTTLADLAPAFAAAVRHEIVAPRAVAFPGLNGARVAQVQLVPLPQALAYGGALEDAVLFVATAPDLATLAAGPDARELAGSRPTAPTIAPAVAPTRDMFGRFVAALAHDVANVLNPVGAAAHLIAQRADDPAAVRYYAARAARAVDSGAVLLSRIARLGRAPLPAEGREPVDLNGLVAEQADAIPGCRAARGESGALQVDRRLDEVVIVHADPAELRVALGHLVANALDAMPQGGTLTLAIRADAADMVVEVHDTGPGMREEVRARACEPYFTTRRSRGRGLGLAEAAAVMRRLGGALELESVVDVGTTARLRFPRDAAVVPALSPGAAPDAVAGAAAAAARRVLIVEDDANTRDFMRVLLTAHGHTVEEASGMGAALLALETAARQGARSPPFDLVLTDVTLGDGSGWELVAAVGSRWPTIRVGVVTGWAVSTHTPEGVAFVLEKPVHVQALLACVAGGP